MSASGERHYRWRVTPPGGVPVVLRFLGGITRPELLLLYRGALVEPIAGTRVDGVQDDDGGDDAQVAT